MTRIPRILFLTEAPTACSEIVLEPFMRLRDEGCIRLTVMHECDHRGWRLRMAARRSEVVFVFRGCTPRAERVCLAARRAGRMVIWSADDDLLGIDPSTEVGARHHEPAIRGATERMIAAADLLWLFSWPLAERYRRFGVPIHVSPVAAPLGAFADVAARASRCEDAGQAVTIGHIGDASHAADMAPLVDVVHRLDLAGLNVPWRFEFAGHLPDELVGHPRVSHVPYIRGVAAFHRWLQAADWRIGIAPLRDTPFNRCKTDNKFRTFAAAGIAGVYAAVAPYIESVRHGMSGLLVPHDPAAYAAALQDLIMDGDRRRRLAFAGWQAVGERHSPARVLGGYREMFAGFPSSSRPSRVGGVSKECA